MLLPVKSSRSSNKTFAVSPGLLQHAVVVMCLWCLAALFSPALGQSGVDGSGTNIGQQISRLKDQIESLKARRDVDEARQAQAIETYQKALAALQAAEADRQQAADLAASQKQVPEDIESVRAELRNVRSVPTIDELADQSLDALTQRVEQTRTRLTDAQARLADARDKLTRAAQRPEQLRAQLADARNALQNLAGSNSVDLGDASGVRARAHSTLVAARRDALNAEIERLQQELSGLDAQERLLEVKRSLAETQVARLNEATATAQTALSRAQIASAETLRDASEDKLSELRTALAPISEVAQKNVELTYELADITEDTQTLSQRQAEQRAQVDSLERRLNLVQRQLEIGGGSVALGDVLRNQRRRLATPSLSFLTSDTLNGLPDVSTAELDRFQLQQTRAELDNPAMMAERIASQADVTLNAGQRESLINLLDQRRTIIDRLIDAEGRYVDVGRDLRSLSRHYNDTLSSFNRLLDERLFWLPSFHGLWLDWPARLAEDVPWLLDPRSWREALAAFAGGIVAKPFRAGLAILVIGALLGMRGLFKRRLAVLAEPVGNVSHDSVALTLRALLATLLLALPTIMLPLSIGYLTQHAPGATPFAKAAGSAVFQLGMLALFIEPFTQVVRANGLAEAHFRWSDKARRNLHRDLRGLSLALVVPIIVISMTEAFDDDTKRETIGRAAFMLGEFSIAIFAWRVLHPVTGVLSDVMTDHENGNWRLGYFWLPVATAIPLALSGMAARGYYYTALQLQSRFFYSAALLGGAVILYSLIVRWLTVAERRIALSRALKRREEAREARASREAAAVSGDSTPETLDGLEIDLVQISEQTRGLIKVVITLSIATGLWLVWSGTLPALQLLDNINLWQISSQANGQKEISNVTLGALLLAIAVSVVTTLAGRNLPGFLEITVLRRLSLDAGSRYAMATLFQYAIVIIGMVIAVNLIGLRWSSIQWLVAAVGVGLGFGLQQIFANFISGILILFERPVRVGDTVTVGALTGTVSRIRIRATTITDWDNKEVVIPNQTFITETVINWTLTDDITRLILRFCVALDTDGDLVERLVHEAIDAEPVALDNPPPSVFMVGYDDSAIIYEARVFYHDLYYLLPLQHAIYRRVHDAFKANGIKIVYPQHDLHLRSMDDSIGEVFRRPSDKSDADETPALPSRS